MTDTTSKILAYMRPKFLNAKISSLIIASILIFANVTLAGETTDEPVVRNLSVDKKNNTISYVLTGPATVRIRVGSRSGPLYRTLVNWQKQKAGNHVVRWNGMDTSGTFNILDSENFTFSFNYYLPGEEKMSILEYLDSDLIITDNFIGKAPRLSHFNQNHKKHNKKYCKDFNVIFKLPPNIERTMEGLPKIRETCPITIEVPNRDKSWFRQERFSINIFIDDVFVRGEALGYTPYTWNFNPKGINEGKHLITVNIKGFNDHIVAGSFSIYVEAMK